MLNGKSINMKTLKINLWFVAVLLLTTYSYAQAVVTTPKRSPRAEFSQTFGITKVTIEYGAPKVKVVRGDRTGKIWGQLIPFGLQKINFAGKGEIPWRAGADENTIITFSTDVKVEGKDLKTGTYGLHMIINDEKNATVIFSKNTSSWGSFWYTPDEDVLRVDVVMRDNAFHDVLNYSATKLDTKQAEFSLSWENKQIPFNVSADTPVLVTDNLKDELRGQFGFGWKGKFQAAQYLTRVNHEPELALQWINESIGVQKMFQNLSLKANILFQQGKIKEAMPLLDEAVDMANNNQLNGLGYLLMTNKQLDKAISYFELNVKRNPKDANVYNSLGEAYKAKGKNKEALKMFKKSNTLNPPKFVKDSNDQFIKELQGK